jgi:hypothetical protein
MRKAQLLNILNQKSSSSAEQRNFHGYKVPQQCFCTFITRVLCVLKASFLFCFCSKLLLCILILNFLHFDSGLLCIFFFCKALALHTSFHLKDIILDFCIQHFHNDFLNIWTMRKTTQKIAPIFKHLFQHQPL